MIMIMDVRYKKFVEAADLFVPTKKSAGNADWDLYACEDTLIHAGHTVGVSTNLVIEFPEGWEAVIEQKSGLALNNSLTTLGGVIDNNYRGHIVVIIHNLGNKAFFVQKGTKIAQLKFREVSPEINWILAESLSETDRGAKGFGSEGLKHASINTC